MGLQLLKCFNGRNKMREIYEILFFVYFNLNYIIFFFGLKKKYKVENFLDLCYDIIIQVIGCRIFVIYSINIYIYIVEVSIL